MTTIKTLLAATALVTLGATVPAEAATFVFSYSGATFGNAATAVGSFTLDDSALADINANVQAPDYGLVSDLTITVSGSGAGDGTFGTSDYNYMIFNAVAPLDFTTDLVGQDLGNRRYWGSGFDSGDFNLFGSLNSFSGPTAYSPYVLNTSSGDKIELISLQVAAVPEPATWAMMLVGFGMMGAAMRYRRRATITTYA